MASLDIKSGIDNGEFLNSINSLFDAYFLISKENIVLNYEIKDDTINLHFGKEKLQGKNFIETFTSQTQQESSKELIQKILERQPIRFEISLIVNGQVRYYDIFIINLANNQLLIIFQNIDEKKKIEFELAEERNTLKNIIELNPYAIEIKDSEGLHVNANKAFIEMFKSVPPPEYYFFEDPHIKKRGLLDKILQLKEG